MILPLSAPMLKTSEPKCTMIRCGLGNKTGFMSARGRDTRDPSEETYASINQARAKYRGAQEKHSTSNRACIITTTVNFTKPIKGHAITLYVGIYISTLLSHKDKQHEY